MIQAYLVYLFLLIVMVLFARKSVKISLLEQRKLPIYHKTILIPILLFTFIIGCRYMVGVDYETYMNIVQEGRDGFAVYNLEFFFKYLVLFLFDNHFHFTWFFIISAFIQIVFFYKAFDKTIFMLLPFAVATFLMTELGALENGVRQFVALMVFFFALCFIKTKEPLKYILLILIGTLFHKSMIICLPFYWILNRNIFKNIVFQYSLLIIILFLTNLFFDDVLKIIQEDILPSTNYDYYSDKLQVEGEGRLGFYTTWVLNLLIIGFFPSMKKYYEPNTYEVLPKRDENAHTSSIQPNNKNVLREKSGFLIYWNLFFIGLLLKPFTDFILVLSRINWYFYKFRFIILAFLLHYLWQHRKNPINMFFFWFFLATIIIFFVYEIYVEAHFMSPFQFIWQK